MCFSVVEKDGGVFKVCQLAFISATLWQFSDYNQLQFFSKYRESSFWWFVKVMLLLSAGRVRGMENNKHKLKPQVALIKSSYSYWSANLSMSTSRYYDCECIVAYGCDEGWTPITHVKLDANWSMYRLVRQHILPCYRCSWHVLAIVNVWLFPGGTWVILHTRV